MMHPFLKTFGGALHVHRQDLLVKFQYVAFDG